MANSFHLFELKQGHAYALAADMVCVDGHACPKGSVIRHQSAMLHLNGKSATVYAKDQEGRALEFVIRDWRTQAWFLPQPPNELYADRKKLASLLSWQPGMERACQILNGGGAKGHWLSSRKDADVLSAAALDVERSLPDAAKALAAKALAEESLSLYYSWMSQATSGGEGTAMQREVQSRLDQMQRIASS